MVYRYGGCSETGDVRNENQDHILCRAGNIGGIPCGLFLVADGMGGLRHGGWASEYTARSFEAWWHRELPPMILAGRDSDEDLEELLEQEIWEINRAVYRFGRERQIRCGTTLSVLLLAGSRGFIRNLGDSRVYRQRDNRIRCLTQDQSLVAQLLREGAITEQEAKISSKKNVLTMCLGMYEEAQSFGAKGRVRNGDVFLLCSDGLYNPLGEARMEELLGLAGYGAEQKAALLRRQIPPGKAHDNVSAVVVEAAER